jgi:cytochrome-b5 reductase
VFANKTTKDILLKEELDEIYKTQNFNFKLSYTIDKMEDGWEGYTGRITKEMISATCPPPGEDTLMLTCGPPVMCSKFLLPMMIEMGYDKTHIFDF